MTPFTALVIDIIRSIPPGKVMTYGQIAACAGSPRGARQVVRILHSMSISHNLPWHRVVNASGRIAIPSDEGVFLQITQLEDEEVEISGRGQIDLDRYRFVP
ncbi:MAG: 6-O-methylguanine methyltransferase [Paenibacillaceae bacterium]|nr:6-O-methylguanine methyltransferase [Paenibacillaceae bacterium]